MKRIILFTIILLLTITAFATYYGLYTGPGGDKSGLVNACLSIVHEFDFGWNSNVPAAVTDSRKRMVTRSTVLMLFIGFTGSV
jgi:hypothetical protein